MYPWFVTSVVSVSVSSLASRGTSASQQIEVTSPTAVFSMGMLTPAAWTGTFIGLKPVPEQVSVQCPWFRKSFVLPSDALSETRADAHAGSATETAGLVYVASAGYHELYGNHKQISL